jgi:hypothetical protein
LRTSLWVVPSLEVLGAVALFGCTLVVDRAVRRRLEAVLMAEAGLALREAA